MPRTMVTNVIHIIFNTRYGRKELPLERWSGLAGQLVAACNQLRSFPLAIGGNENHVHLLCMLSKTVSLARLVETLKSESAIWMRMQSESLARFAWQRGYTAFSVSHAEIPETCTYILRQPEFHCHTRFEDELRNLLADHGLAFDKRAVLE